MEKIYFDDRYEAIEWIAEFAQDEGHFEVLRERLNFNYIYSGVFYLELNETISEVILIEDIE